MSARLEYTRSDFIETCVLIYGVYMLFFVLIQSEEKNDENKSEKINGSKVDAPENGHKNGKEIDNVDNM